VLHLVLLLQHEIWVLLTILNCCAYSKSCDNMYCKMIKRKIKQKNAVNFEDEYSIRSIIKRHKSRRKGFFSFYTVDLSQKTII